MHTAGEDGYKLWLGHCQVNDPDRLARYRKAIGSAVMFGTNATAAIAQSEFAWALPGLLGSFVPRSEKPADSALVVGTGDELAELAGPD